MPKEPFGEITALTNGIEGGAKRGMDNEKGNEDLGGARRVKSPADRGGVGVD